MTNLTDFDKSAISYAVQQGWMPPLDQITPAQRAAFLTEYQAAGQEFATRVGLIARNVADVAQDARRAWLAARGAAPAAPPTTPPRKTAGRKTNTVYLDAYRRIYEQNADRAAVIDELLTVWIADQRSRGLEPDASMIDAERKRIASGIDYQLKRSRESGRQ